MIKKVFFSLVLLLGVGMGIGFGLSKSEEASNAVIANPVIAAEDETIVESSVTSDNSQQEILAQSPEEILQSLNNKATKNLEPGWIHLHTEIVYDTDMENNGVLPNGVEIPLHQINDAWYLLNEESLVIESVFIMKTTDGDIVQIGTYKNGVGNNSVIDDPVSEVPYPLALDGGLSRAMTQMRERGEVFTFREFVNANGVTKVEFNSTTTFEIPIKSIDYNQRTISNRSRIVFDKETGVMELKEIIAYLENGTERVFQKLTQEVTKEAPTDEAMKLLNERGDE